MRLLLRHKSSCIAGIKKHFITNNAEIDACFSENKRLYKC